ncbi:hypothetical protein [Bradyrhizobium sp. USDA 4486]
MSLSHPQPNLTVPLIGIWVRLLRLPVGVYSTHNSVFDILLVAAFGCIGAIFLLL